MEMVAAAALVNTTAVLALGAEGKAWRLPLVGGVEMADWIVLDKKDFQEIRLLLQEGIGCGVADGQGSDDHEEPGEGGGSYNRSFAGDGMGMACGDGTLGNGAGFGPGLSRGGGRHWGEGHTND